MSNRNDRTVEICKELDVVVGAKNTKTMSSVFEKIISKIADKHNLNPHEVRNAVRSLFSFTSYLLKRSIRNKDLEDVEFSKDDLVKIRWIGFGSFQISEWRVNNYFKNRLKDEE